MIADSVAERKKTIQAKVNKMKKIIKKAKSIDMNKLSNTKMRIIASGGLILAYVIAAALEYFGIPGVRILAMIIIAGMGYEMISTFLKCKKAETKTKPVKFGLFLHWAIFLVILGVAAFEVSSRPWVMLLMLMTISLADVGAWFFGRIIGGDKMWENVSPNKSWSGQIMGIIIGTIGAISYGYLGADTFMAELMWIGISVSLLSQYGDLTASWLKRKLNIKDFGTIIPGHGGFTDRFDGWIYVLPIIWLVTF